MIIDESHVMVPFESGDLLAVTWADGSYSDNFERIKGDLPFVADPISVEVAIKFGAATSWGDIVHGWQVVPQVLELVNILAAPRAVLTDGGTFF